MSISGSIAERLARASTQATAALLAERNAAGYWEGELSTSALSTATAVMALELLRRSAAASQDSRKSAPAASVSGGDAPPLPPPDELKRLIDGGIHWLAAHQNSDGGWGDTIQSFSNISTTMLVHAVFHATGTCTSHARQVEAARGYLDRAGGIPALRARYGKDHTFSIPILTHCALAGLVDWREIPPLPFELACLPANFYKFVSLRVVSYALPALIAVGQVRFHQRKPLNPVMRLIRSAAVAPSLRVLEQIQPTNGGFLEATPLTSFVTMSLAGMGLAQHPVARRGAAFLIASVRPDGSWPIDTNLATWVTTLSVNALGDDFPVADRAPVREWLLSQQYQEVHPYTNADPGAWAWTNLPGGVPDADDTPGAILALLNLADRRQLETPDASELAQPAIPHPAPPCTESESDALAAAVDWLLDLQNRDGGWPTFCRGWGALPFDRSGADLTAHALRALTAWQARVEPPAAAGDIAGLSSIANRRAPPLSKGGPGGVNEASLSLPGTMGASAANARRLQRAKRACRVGFAYLERVQRPDGAWLPLWFGNQHAPDDINPVYGTSRVLAAFDDADLNNHPAAQRGRDFLSATQNADGGWGGAKGCPSSVEETSLAVEALLRHDPRSGAADAGTLWLIERAEAGRLQQTTPIGFYFAKLWYFERLYPLIFAASALKRAHCGSRNGESAAGPGRPPSVAALLD